MKSILHVAGAAFLLTVSAMAQENEEWAPSQFGAEDRLGAVNHLSPEGTLAAAELITTGKTYSLGMITGRDTPTISPREYDITVLQLSDGSGVPTGENLVTANDDLVRTFVGIGSQVDGLGHIGINHRHYNGVHVSEFVTTAGLTQFGTEQLPPIATRGVLLDMTKLFETSLVPDGTAFNKAEIDAALEAAELTLRTGDIVLFHTGKMAAGAEGPFSPT